MFATPPSTEEGELKDLGARLTNSTIHRSSENFVQCGGLNEKVEDYEWSLPFFWQSLQSRGIDHRKVQADLEDVTTSTVIAGMCAVRNSHPEKLNRHRRCSFEFLGVDLLLNENLKVC
jgi:hypothetical protein